MDGLLVATDAALVEALVRLGTDPGLRAKFAAAAQTSVTWAATLALTEQAYAEAAALVGRQPAQRVGRRP